MDSPFSVISNFFTDGIFGNLIRFLFDRIFGSHFSTNINISSITSLKGGFFKDLQLDPVKVNRKHFKNSPIKLFSGSVGSLTIKFPSLNKLLTESIEVGIERVDLLFYLDDVDYSSAENDTSQQPKKEGTQEEENIEAEMQNLDKNFDVYKKIVNKILLNMQLKIQNLCIRIVSEKPYKDIRLPVAPCLLLKIGEIDFKRDLKKSDQNEASMMDESGLIFTKHHKYDISISGITAHMMSNYELKTTEYQGDTTSNPVFPFNYPNEFHPSTFFVCACKKNTSKSSKREIEPIDIKINFSDDKSKTVDINIPHIELMLDFLKLKYISKYIDKGMDFKRFSDYKKALNLLAKPTKKPRKGSFDVNPEGGRRSRRGSEIMNADLQPNKSFEKIKIAGYYLDKVYFTANKELSAEIQPENSKAISDFDIEGIKELENDNLSPENLLDTSNVKIKLQLSSFHVYLLKYSSTFMDSEFKRYWLFGSKPQSDSPNFNKRIPINYFQVRLKKLEFTHDTKESNTEIQFNSFSVFDVDKIDTPLKYKMNQTMKSNAMSSSSHYQSMHGGSSYWNRSDIYQSFKQSQDPANVQLVMENSMSSDNFEMARSQLTKSFLNVREVTKPLVDWELDSKSQHFCINVIFKLSKAVRENNGFSSDKKSHESSKMNEDAIIHTPLNGGPLNPENEHPQKKILFRIQNKHGKQTITIELTQIYFNFYPRLVNDFNLLLNDTSSGFEASEGWYYMQNQDIIKRWEEDEKVTSIRKESEKKVDEKKISQTIEDYEATQRLNLDVTFSLQMIKVVVNTENPEKDITTCFCGFTSLFSERLSHSNPLFDKEFIIIDIESIGAKAVKNVNGGIVDQTNQNLCMVSSLIFQSINVYIPNNLKNSGGNILLNCLLSIHSLKLNDSDDSRVIPNIVIKKYEDNYDVISEESEFKDYRESTSPFKKSRQSLNFESDRHETKELYERFQDHMNKNMLYDGKYMQLIKSESQTIVGIAIPVIEIFISRYHLSIINKFLNNLKTRIKDVDKKMKENIEKERKYFADIIQKGSIPKKPSCMSFILCVDHLDSFSFFDEMISKRYGDFIEKKKISGNISEIISSNSIRLDASEKLDRSMNQSYVPQNITNAIKMQFPSSEFFINAKQNLSVLIRHLESIVHKNPNYGVNLAHAEVYDLNIIDRSQEFVSFGQFERVKEPEKKEFIYENIESYFAIVYKQSGFNYNEKKLTTYKPFKNEEYWKSIIVLNNLYFLDASLKVFEFKKTNVLSLGLFSHNSKDRDSTDITLRLSELNFRSDFKLECLTLIKDISEGLQDSSSNDINPGDLSLNRSPSVKKNNALLIKISLENLILDLNPYYTSSYYSSNIDKSFKTDSSNFNLILYSGMRTLIAIESIQASLSKKEADLKLEVFKTAEIDILTKNYKNSSFEDNGILLRSAKADGNLFGQNYLELKEKYKFVFHLLNLSSFIVEMKQEKKITSIIIDEEKVLESSEKLKPSPEKESETSDVVSLGKLSINIHYDAISAIENQVHLIMHLLNMSKPKSAELKQPVPEKKSNLKKPSKNVYFKEDKSKQNAALENVIEIIPDYFKDDEKFNDDDVIEIDDDDDSFNNNVGKLSGSSIKENKEYDMYKSIAPHYHDDVVDVDDEKEGMQEYFLDAPDSSPHKIGPIESNLNFFSEKIMHKFVFNGQEPEKKVIFRLKTVEINIFSGPIFEIKSQEQELIKENDQDMQEEISKNICLKIDEAEAHLVNFKTDPDCLVKINWRVSSSIKNIELLEIKSNGKEVPLFSKLENTDSLTISGIHMFNRLKGSKITSDHFINFIAEGYERKNQKRKDLRLFLGVHPIELNLGMPHHNFFKKFMENMEKKKFKLKDLTAEKEMNSSDMTKKQIPPVLPYFIPMLVIAPLEIRMKINLDISVISIDLFKDCTLLFKTFVGRGIDHPAQLKVRALEFYLKQVKQQIGKFFKDLPLLRNLKNLSKATLNVFYTPYSEFRGGGNVVLGLKDGIVDFFGSVTSESSNLVSFLTGTVGNIATKFKE